MLREIGETPGRNFVGAPEGITHWVSKVLGNIRNSLED